MKLNNAASLALGFSEGGSLPMIFPTYASLRTLADFESVESLVAEYRKVPAP
jgi:hypothetical protein